MYYHQKWQTFRLKDGGFQKISFSNLIRGYKAFFTAAIGSNELVIVLNRKQAFIAPVNKRSSLRFPEALNPLPFQLRDIRAFNYVQPYTELFSCESAKFIKHLITCLSFFLAC